MITSLQSKIVNEKLNNKDMRCVDIAEYLNCSREYVRLTLKDFGLPTVVVRERIVKRCIRCARVIWRYNMTGICAKCKHNAFTPYVKLDCMWCGNEYRLPLHMYKVRKKRHTLNFCSKHCLGKYCGNRYGFGRKINQGL